MNQDSTSKNRTILITNDDGIFSPFLIPLLKSLRNSGELYVVAPSTEQSWSGFKLPKVLEVNEVELPFCNKAWSIENGSPVACVDIAYHQLLSQKPDIVISGVNIGANTSWQYLLSSGTFAAAQQGFNLNIQSIAISQALSPEFSKMDRCGLKPISKNQEDLLDNNFSRIPLWVNALLNQDIKELWSINLPYTVDESTDTVYTIPAHFKKTELYKKTPEGSFLFHPRSEETIEIDSDRKALREGKISISRFLKNLS